MRVYGCMTAVLRFKTYLAGVAAALLFAATLAPAVALMATTFYEREKPRTQKPRERRRVSNRPVLAVAPVVGSVSKRS